MSKSYTVGYMPKPSYSGTKYEELKDVLKESGIISEHTPDNAIPTVVEESLVDLKPENIRGNVKIGNVVGNIIETLEDVSVDYIDTYPITDFTGFNIYNVKARVGQYTYGFDGETTLNTKLKCYNTLTNETTLLFNGSFVPSRASLVFNGYHGYVVGGLDNEVNTNSIKYIYKDEVSVLTDVEYISATCTIVDNKAYIITKGSNSYKTVSGVYCFEGQNYTKLIGSNNNATFTLFKTVDKTIYIGCNSSDLSEGGIYKIVDKTVTKLIDVASTTFGSTYIIDKTLYIVTSNKNIYKLENDIVTLVAENLLANAQNITASENGNIYFEVGSSYNTIYCLPKNTNQLVSFADSYSKINVFSDTKNKIDYIKMSNSKNILKFDGNEFSIVYTFSSYYNVYYFESKNNGIFFTYSTKLINIKNDTLTELTLPTASYYFFEDIDGTVYCGRSTWYKIVGTTVEQVYTGSSDFNRVLPISNNRFVLLSSSAGSTATQKIIIFKDGTFTPLVKNKQEVLNATNPKDDIIVVEFEKSSNTATLDTLIVAVQIINDKYIEYKIK